jgi:sporulation protein YlmC with PRC-barrel domain
MDEFEAAGRLFDRQIEDSSGALVGRVEDLVVDLTSGQIEYVLIALPRQDSAECETVGVDKTVLERAVSERRRRHRADSRRLARRVRRYQFED